MLTIDRRGLIAGAGPLALFSGLLAHPALAAVAFKEDPFTLGVAAGDPAPDGFVIWTRLAPHPLEFGGGMPTKTVAVRWEVAEDDRFAKVVQSGEALARAELAHSVHVEVEGLQPGRPYWYRFLIPGATTSPVGTARTAPAAGVTPERVRIGVAGCQNYEGGFFTAYRCLSQESDLDAIFHYGDYIYEGASGKGALNGHGKDRTVARKVLGEETYSLDDYRRRYAQYKADPDLRAAHHAAAFIVSFDDHEVDNNWASQYDEKGTPPEIFALRRIGAMQAWYEHMPVRRAQFPVGGVAHAYRRLDYGALFRMHVLDTRTYRDIQLCEGPKAPKNCRTDNGPDVTIMGKAQEAWLAEGLTNQARWNFIAQQVMVMPLDRRQSASGPPVKTTDNWDGYPAARTRLVKAITERRLTNVIIATGDAHQHYVGTVPVRDEAPDGPAAATEFLGTSVSSGCDGSPVREDSTHFLEFNPNLKLVNNQRGYQTLDFTPKGVQANLQVLDRVTTPGGTLSKLASFIVTPDKPGVHRA